VSSQAGKKRTVLAASGNFRRKKGQYIKPPPGGGKKIPKACRHTRPTQRAASGNGRRPEKKAGQWATRAEQTAGEVSSWQSSVKVSREKGQPVVSTYCMIKRCMEVPETRFAKKKKLS